MVVFVPLAALLPGCATFMGDTVQPISIITTCSGSSAVLHAQCAVSNSRGARSIATPGAVEVARDSGDLTISCVAPGADGQAVLKASGNWNTAGNILLGGIVGVGVDLASGAGYEYPKTIMIEMRCATDAR